MRPPLLLPIFYVIKPNVALPAPENSGVFELSTSTVASLDVSPC